MATRNIVPRANGEGQIGTTAKKWNKIYTDLLYVGDDLMEIDPIGRPIFDVILRPGYIKANGAAVADAFTAIPRLLAFVQANPSLLAADAAEYAANVGLYLYDSGTDTLTLPDYVNKFMEGGNSVESIEAGLPNIKGTVSCNPRLSGSSNALAVSVGNEAGAFSSDKDSTTYASVTNADGVASSFVMKFSAASSNPIYSDSVTTVQPSSITLIPQIRY